MFFMLQLFNKQHSKPCEICAEWTRYEAGEIKETVKGKKEQSQEDSWSKEGKTFFFFVLHLTI